MSSSKNLDEVRRLERLAFRGWPALESQDVQGWHLRFSGGYTKRANSINALGPQASTDIEAVEAPFRERNSRPAWRLTPLAPVGMADLLKGRGYQAIERSVLQRCPLHEDFRSDPAVDIAASPGSAWVEAFATHSPVKAEHRETMQRMLEAIAQPAGFAFVRREGRPMAMAIGAVEGDHMGLFDVLVMPEARRQGLARRVTESLYAWAWAKGARFAYLQVVATNAAAMPLYAAQGFRTVYEYEYLIPPAS
jgi:GNAT superfamily N-acetyltransferase